MGRLGEGTVLAVLVRLLAVLLRLLAVSVRLMAVLVRPLAVLACLLAVLGSPTRAQVWKYVRPTKAVCFTLQ